MPPIYRNNGSFVLKITNTGQAISLGIPSNGMQLANRLDIQALPGNVNPIIIGDYTVLADQSAGGISLGTTKNGQGAFVGDVYDIEILTCLAPIFMNGTAGDGIAVNWWIGERP